MSYTIYQKINTTPPDLQKQFPALLQPVYPGFVKHQQKC